MRGSPFTFSSFSLGLNTLDSPYTLKSGESRDCLNTLSTPRGAIKKRYGSIVLASTKAATFPALAVTDSFKRANEKPLKKDGKGNESAWEILDSRPNAGEIAGNKWEATGGPSGALYNVKEETNPAVSVEVGQLGGKFSVRIASKGATAEGYRLNVTSVEVELTVAIGAETKTLATAATTPTEVGDVYGLTAIGGIVIGWRKRGGVWVRLIEVINAAFTKGYGAVSSEGSAVGLKNFSLGEALAGSTILEPEVLSLGSVYIAGVPYLIASVGTKLVSINASGEVSVIKEGMTEGKRWDLIQAAEGTRVAQGPVYMSNGTDPPQYWTGATKSTEAKEWTSEPKEEFVAVPKAKYMVYHGNRIWATGIASSPSEVRWSGFAAKAGEGEVADPTDWPKANVLWLEKDDGLPITGIESVGPYVLVFKAHATWVIYDLNEGENRQISGTTGCVSNRSIVETPLGTFFLSPDKGVFITNGSKVQEMSRNVRNLLQGFDPIEGRKDRAAKLNELENTAAGFLNGHYYLSYMAQDESMKTLDYDTQLKSWWLHDLAGNEWVAWEPVSGEASLYTAPRKAKAGVVKAFVPGTYQDSGQNYTGKALEVHQHEGEKVSVTLTSFWSSSWEPFWQYFMRHRFQQPQIKKRIRTLFLDGAGETEAYAWRNFKELPQRLLGVTEKADIATESTYTPKPGATEETEYQAVRYYSLGTGRVWSFMFGNQTAEPMEVDTYAADLYFRKG